MKLKFVAVVAVVLLGGAAARANFIALYTSNTLNVYNYTLRFTVDQPGEVLRSGDTVTLYDLGVAADIVSVTPPSPPAGVFSVSQQSIGITPGILVGSAGLFDSTFLQNITFTYTGPQISAAQDFTGAQLTMPSLYHSVVVGREAGSTGIRFAITPDPGVQGNASIRTVLLPTVLACCSQNTPEPGSLAVMGLGAMALVVRRRRAGNVTFGSRL